MEITIRGEGDSSVAFVAALIKQALARHKVSAKTSMVYGSKNILPLVEGYERDIEKDPEASMEFLFYGEPFQLRVDKLPNPPSLGSIVYTSAGVFDYVACTVLDHIKDDAGNLIALKVCETGLPESDENRVRELRHWELTVPWSFF